MMRELQKIFSHFYIAAIGACFMFVGSTAFENSGDFWLRNAFVYGGILIMIISLCKSLDSFIMQFDPNYGRDTHIVRYLQQTENAVNRAYGRVHRFIAAVFLILTLGLAALGASAMMLISVAAAYLALELGAIWLKKREFGKLWKEREE